jgi:hypothetical protein
MTYLRAPAWFNLCTAGEPLQMIEGIAVITFNRFPQVNYVAYISFQQHSPNTFCDMRKRL